MSVTSPAPSAISAGFILEEALLSTYQYYDALQKELADQMPFMDRSALEGIALTHIPLALAVSKFLDALEGQDAEEVQAAAHELSIVYEPINEQPKGNA